MNFQEFWRRLAAELEHRKGYETLKRSRPFEAVFSDSVTVTVRPESEMERAIPVGQFQGMWEIMKNDTRSKRYVNTGKRYYSFWSSSYINALIDHVVSDRDME